MAGAAGRPARGGRRAALAGAALALALVPGRAADWRSDREAVCRTFIQKAAEHDDMTLALLCRSRVPTDVCREVQTSLGKRPWTPERIGATCHTWTDSARLRLLMPSSSSSSASASASASSSASAAASASASAAADDSRDDEEDTTDTTAGSLFTFDDALFKKVQGNTQEKVDYVDGVIQEKSNGVIKNITSIDKALCEKTSGLEWDDTAEGDKYGLSDVNGTGACVVSATTTTTTAETQAAPAPTAAPAAAAPAPVAEDASTESGAARATTDSGSNAAGSTPSVADIGFAEMPKSPSDADANVSAGAVNVTLGGAPAENATTNGTAGAGAVNVTSGAPAENITTNGTVGAGAVNVTSGAPAENATTNSTVGAGAVNVTSGAPAENATTNGTVGAGAVSVTSGAPEENATTNGTVGAGAVNVTSGALAENATTNGTTDAGPTAAPTAAPTASPTPSPTASPAAPTGLTTNLSSLGKLSAAAINVTAETTAGNASAKGAVGAGPNESVIDDTRLFDLRHRVPPAAGAGGVALAAAAGVVLLVASVSAARRGPYAHRYTGIVLASPESDVEEDGGASRPRTLLPSLESHRARAAARSLE